MEVVTGGLASHIVNSQLVKETEASHKIIHRSGNNIVGLSDGLTTNALWMREMLIAQGYTLPPTVIYQNNTQDVAPERSPLLHQGQRGIR
jgi:hypothetical protein